MEAWIGNGKGARLPAGCVLAIVCKDLISDAFLGFQNSRGQVNQQGKCISLRKESA